MIKLVALYSALAVFAAEIAYLCYWLTLPVPIWKTPSTFGWIIGIISTICMVCIFYLATRAIFRQRHPLLVSIYVAVLVAGYVTLYAILYKGYGLYATHCLPGDQECLTTSIHSGFIALYFSAITLATVGYGDYIPANDIGRTFAAIEALSGYFLLALLISAITAVLTSKR